MTMTVFLTSGKKISDAFAKGVGCITLPGSPPRVSYTFLRTVMSSVVTVDAMYCRHLECSQTQGVATHACITEIIMMLKS